jgi:hypothetical protein
MNRHQLPLFALLAFALSLSVIQSPAAPARAQGGAPKGSASVKTLPAKAKRFALVIGVDRYDDTQITTLGGASNDARALASALTAHAGFPSDQVVLLASDQPAERRPTRGNVLRRLSNLAEVVPKDGLLLFAFAGHGMERGGQAFLLPSDAQVSDDVTLLEQTAVNVLQVKDWVRRTGVRQVLLILDACRNDPSGRSDADNPLTETYTRALDFDRRNREVEAFVALYATAIGRRAYEFREKRQGYFTWALVEGLKGAAANDRGEVTLGGLVAYLQERVPKQVALDLGKGKVQRPYAVVEGYKADELVLAVADGRDLRLAQTFEDDGPEPAASEPENPPPGSGVVIGERAGPSVVNLEGTTWSGFGSTGEYAVEFLAGGQLRHLVDGVLNGKKHQFVSRGTWKQVGDFVQMTVNEYSVFTGRIEGRVMKGEGTNSAGEKWSWALTPKEK